MDSIAYRNMDDEELKAILLCFKTTANRLMDRISALKIEPSGYTWKVKRDDIIAEYKVIKNRLKEIYHYTQLARNKIYEYTFYNSIFRPAITDCFVHCNAKTNGTNLDSLYNSLWEIWDYILYYIPENS